MSDAVAALVAELEAAAHAAWKEEEALRNRMAQEIARLERRRAFAHRRAHLVRTLAAAVAGAETEEAAAAAVRAAVRRDLDWESETDFRRAVLDRLQPAGVAVWSCARASEGAEPAAIQAALEDFEAWYEATHGAPFYVLFDQEPAEVALVETF
jgi:hypothetical protein